MTRDTTGSNIGSLKLDLRAPAEMAVATSAPGIDAAYMLPGENKTLAIAGFIALTLVIGVIIYLLLVP